MTTIDIPVRIGSNRLSINLSIGRMTHLKCSEFLLIVLKKCKLTQTANMYALWEQEQGIERMLNLNDRFKVNSNAQLVVRKYKQTELNLIRNLNLCSNGGAIERRTRKYYEKRHRTSATVVEDIVAKITSQPEQQDTVKMCQFHQKKFSERLSQQNANFLRYLYIKLKKTNYSLFSNEKSILLNESMHSCGSTSRSTSGSSIGLIDKDDCTSLESFV